MLRQVITSVGIAGTLYSLSVGQSFSRSIKLNPGLEFQYYPDGEIGLEFGVTGSLAQSIQDNSINQNSIALGVGVFKLWNLTPQLKFGPVATVSASFINDFDNRGYNLLLGVRPRYEMNERLFVEGDFGAYIDYSDGMSSDVISTGFSGFDLGQLSLGLRF
jgi:hypothetical protein